jgi:hypothetical protein
VTRCHDIDVYEPLSPRFLTDPTHSRVFHHFSPKVYILYQLLSLSHIPRTTFWTLGFISFSLPRALHCSGCTKPFDRHCYSCCYRCFNALSHSKRGVSTINTLPHLTTTMAVAPTWTRPKNDASSPSPVPSLNDLLGLADDARALEKLGGDYGRTCLFLPSLPNVIMPSFECSIN